MLQVEAKTRRRCIVPLEIRSDKCPVTLRQHSMADSKEAFALIDRNRAHLSKFSSIPKLYPTLSHFEQSIRYPENPKKFSFGIRNSEGTLVGGIEILPVKVKLDSTRSTFVGLGTIGYYRGKEFQGNGYMTNAVGLLTRYAFNNLGYNQLYGVVAPSNEASIKVLKKNGYTNLGLKHGFLVYSRILLRD